MSWSFSTTSEEPPFSRSRAISVGSSTSGSTTCSSDLERRWLPSNRPVSWLASTSSVPPVTKPAINTRWNAETSSLAWIGVSIGISKYVVPQPIAAIAASAAIAARAGALRLRLFFRGARSIIDFLEKLVVLLDLLIVRLQGEGLFVRRASLIELPLVFVGDRQVVEGRCVSRVDLDGLFPAIDGLAPEPALRDVDSEIDLSLRLAADIRVGGRRHGCAGEDEHDGKNGFH